MDFSIHNYCWISTIQIDYIKNGFIDIHKSQHLWISERLMHLEKLILDIEKL